MRIKLPPLTSSLLLALVLLVSRGVPLASADETVLTLSGYRWEQPVVAYWINIIGKGVSAAAVDDVETAIAEWNLELLALAEAGYPVPVLSPATSLKKAGIVFNLRIRETRNTFGGTAELIGGYYNLPTTEGCVLVKQHFSMQGTALGSPGSPRIRNMTRHLMGEALGLGHIACSSGGIQCTGSLMEGMHHWSLIPDEDVAISSCEVAALIALYGPDFCEDIPPFIPYECP